MNTRPKASINIDTIVNELDQALANPQFAHFHTLLQITKSKLLQEDQNQAQYLQSRKDKLQRPDKNFIDELSHEYKTLANTLREMSKVIRDQAGKQAPKEIIQIADNIHALSTIIPNVEDMRRPDLAERLLFGLCKQLGGTSIRISQNHLSTLGGYRLGDQVFSSEGTCSGIVCVWMGESVETGTPTYPVTANMAVQYLQEKQGTIRRDEMSHKEIEQSELNYTFNLDFERVLNQLETNMPYYVCILDEKAPGGHAIGIRKHPHYIEILDPNYGYFFLPSVNTAATLLSALLQIYRATKFPSQLIFFMEPKTNGKPIPNSLFPDKSLLETNVVLPYTDDGYKTLRRIFLRLTSIVVNAPLREADDYGELIYHSLINNFRHLTTEDRAKMLATLRSLLEKKDSDFDEGAYGNFINKDTHDILKLWIHSAPSFKTGFENLIKKLENLESHHQLLDPSKLAIADKASLIAHQLSEQIILLSNNVKDLMLNPEINRIEINKLTIKIAILRSRRSNYLKSHLREKLIAAQHGSIQFDDTQAREEFKTLFHLDETLLNINPNNRDEINLLIEGTISEAQLLTLAEKNEKLTALKALLETMHSEKIYNRRNRRGIFKLYDQTRDAFREKAILDTIALIETIQNALLAEEDASPLLETLFRLHLNGVIDKLNDIPSLNNEQDIEKLYNGIENHLHQSFHDQYQFNNDQLKLLDDIHCLVSTKPDGALREAATAMPESAIRSELMGEVNALNNLVCEAVKFDPCSKSEADEIIQNLQSILTDLYRETPLAYTVTKANATKNMESYQNLHDFSYRLINLIKTMKKHFSNDPEFYNSLKYVLYKLRDLEKIYLEQGKVSFRTHLTSVLNLLNIHGNTSFRDLNGANLVKYILNSRTTQNNIPEEKIQQWATLFDNERVPTEYKAKLSKASSTLKKLTYFKTSLQIMFSNLDNLQVRSAVPGDMAHLYDTIQRRKFLDNAIHDVETAIHAIEARKPYSQLVENIDKKYFLLGDNLDGKSGCVAMLPKYFSGHDFSFFIDIFIQINHDSFYNRSTFTDDDLRHLTYYFNYVSDLQTPEFAKLLRVNENDIPSTLRTSCKKLMSSIDEFKEFILVGVKSPDPTRKSQYFFNFIEDTRRWFDLLRDDARRFSIQLTEEQSRLNHVGLSDLTTEEKNALMSLKLVVTHILDTIVGVTNNSTNRNDLAILKELLQEANGIKHSITEALDSSGLSIPEIHRRGFIANRIKLIRQIFPSYTTSHDLSSDVIANDIRQYLSLGDIAHRVSLQLNTLRESLSQEQIQSLNHTLRLAANAHTLRESINILFHALSIPPGFPPDKITDELIALRVLGLTTRPQHESLSHFDSNESETSYKQVVLQQLEHIILNNDLWVNDNSEEIGIPKMQAAIHNANGDSSSDLLASLASIAKDRLSLPDTMSDAFFTYPKPTPRFRELFNLCLEANNAKCEDEIFSCAESCNRFIDKVFASNVTNRHSQGQ